MSRNVLSGEQALTDYFSALLDESEELEVEQEKEPESESEKEEEPSDDFSYAEPYVPQLQASIESSDYEEPKALTYSPVPDLKDVERLLGQLESANPVADIENVEKIIEENTNKIKSDYRQRELQEVIKQETPEVQQPEVVVAEQTVPQDATQAEDEVAVEVSEETSALQSDGSGSGWGDWESVKRTSDFQVLYFDVNGVTFAVPLDELGGIHQIAELNHLIGRPKWYLGLQTNKNSQLDVVDTACWVMADKLKDDSYKESYHHIVMLGESLWGLACGELKGTALLETDHVRWREQVGKRPWLAGMVKEKMCALINVEALIAMLNAGLDVKALDK